MIKEAFSLTVHVLAALQAGVVGVIMFAMGIKDILTKDTDPLTNHCLYIGSLLMVCAYYLFKR